MIEDGFDDVFIRSFYHANLPVVNRLVSGKPQFKEDSKVQFDAFLKYLSRFKGKIYNYIIKENPEKPKIFEAKCGIFKFKYTIKENKTSKFEASFTTNVSREYDSGFLISKVKPSFGYVYFIYSEYGYKIGMTKNIEERLRVFGVKLPFDVKLHSYIRCKNYQELETFLHTHLIELRLNGEWFDLNKDSFDCIDRIISNMGLTRINHYE